VKRGRLVTTLATRVLFPTTVGVAAVPTRICRSVQGVDLDFGQHLWDDQEAIQIDQKFLPR
jgi:hypothetical protein